MQCHLTAQADFLSVKFRALLHFVFFDAAALVIVEDGVGRASKSEFIHEKCAVRKEGVEWDLHVFVLGFLSIYVHVCGGEGNGN